MTILNKFTRITRVQVAALKYVIKYTKADLDVGN